MIRALTTGVRILGLKVTPEDELKLYTWDQPCACPSGKERDLQGGCSTQCPDGTFSAGGLVLDEEEFRNNPSWCVTYS